MKKEYNVFGILANLLFVGACLFNAYNAYNGGKLGAVLFSVFVAGMNLATAAFLYFIGNNFISRERVEKEFDIKSIGEKPTL